MPSRRPRRPRTEGQQRIYGRSARPQVEIPVGDDWVAGELLVKILDEHGTWWSRVVYVHPDTFESVVELLPSDVVRQEAAAG